MPQLKISTGDNRNPIAMQCVRPDGEAVDLTGLTVKFTMLKHDGTDKVAETTDNVTIHPTKTFTAAVSDLVTSVKHGLSNNDEVILSTTGTLPAGLSTGTRYFVVNASRDTFYLSDIPGGSAVNITDTGSGTHSLALVGSVQYAPDAADVDTAGKYRCYFIVVDGSSLREHFPSSKQEKYELLITDE